MWFCYHAMLLQDVLSVHPFATLQCCAKTAKRTVKILSLPAIPIIVQCTCIFLRSEPRYGIPIGTLSGAMNTGGA